MKSSLACRTFPWATLRRINTAWLTLLVLNGRTSYKILCSNKYTCYAAETENRHIYFIIVHRFTLFFIDILQVDFIRIERDRYQSQFHPENLHQRGTILVCCQSARKERKSRLNEEFTVFWTFVSGLDAVLRVSSVQRWSLVPRKVRIFCSVALFRLGSRFSQQKVHLLNFQIFHVFPKFSTSNSINNDKSALSKNRPRQNFIRALKTKQTSTVVWFFSSIVKTLMEWDKCNKFEERLKSSSEKKQLLLKDSNSIELFFNLQTFF